VNEIVQAGNVCNAPHRGDRYRTTAPGLRLCLSCRDRLASDIARLPDLYADLELALIHDTPTQDERITHRKDPGLVVNQRAVAARTLIRHELVSTTRMVIEERGLVTWPADTVSAMAAWLAAHIDWLAAHEIAVDVAAEYSSVRAEAQRVAYPAKTRRWFLSPCVEDNCDGALMVTIRSDDDLLPSAITCDKTTEHTWEPNQWLALGRRIRREGYEHLALRLDNPA